MALTDVPPGAPGTPSPAVTRGAAWRTSIASAEIDVRMAGMVAALAVIWIGFNILSDGDFLTARNLWNLSVQSTSIAIMATGMVLVIVSRNIDLSVGSLLGFLGYAMAMVQTKWIPRTFNLGLNHWYIWVVTLLVGIALGAAIGTFQGFLVGYIRIPAFVVTLGGYLIWRGLIFRFAQGQTLAPLDKTFQLLGGGPRGSLGEWKSWLLAAVACAGIVASIVIARRRRRFYGLQLRSLWVDRAIAVLGCAAVVAAVAVANRYYWPEQLARLRAIQHGQVYPPGGLHIPTGVAYPVVLLIAVTLLMTYLARRRRFGRYVYAIGGNPLAAELGGINTRRTIMLTFSLMGVLCALSAAVQTARLDAAVTNLGVTNELEVIAATVIGGTSFSGGVGTIPGAVLGAVIMQSLRSGMVLLKVDSPAQDVVLGLVLIAAVGLDSLRLALPDHDEDHVTDPATTPDPPASRGVPLVELRDIRVSFGGVHAVDGVTVDLYPGEVVGLVGGNGAGKSTLIHTLSGAHPADSGQILINGQVVSIRTPRDARAHGIEAIYQTLALADNIDAAGNVFLGRELLTRSGSLDDSAMASATRKVIERLNPMFTNLKTPVRSLSGGQRQAVAIARAVHFNARILIMDEPTAALGPAETEQVHELIFRLKAEGIGIFLISHDIHSLFDIADRISVMLQGKLVGTVNRADVTKDEVLAMIIVGQLPNEVSADTLAQLHN